MNIFKEDKESKRVIFNIRADLAKRLEKAKNDARQIGKKLDTDGAVNDSLENFLKKAEKKISEKMKKKGLAVIPCDDESEVDDITAEDTDIPD